MAGQQFIPVGTYTNSATGRTFNIEWDRAGGRVYVKGTSWRSAQTVREDAAYDVGKALIISNDRR